MTLSIYNYDILNFLYELTKLNRFMSYKNLSKNISLERKKSVSPKTIERWFNFLKKKYYHPQSKTKEKFNFYPTFFFEKLGLVAVRVISEKPDLKILDMLPFQNYAAWLFDPKINKSVLLTGYLVPIVYLEKFKLEWRKIKQKNLVKNYNFYVAHKGFNIYSPWHRVIDENGVFHAENNVKEEIDKQLKKFESYLNNLPKIEMIPVVRKNPLMIPILFECCYQYWTSPKVWKAIKTKLRDNLYNYIQKKKIKTDAMGIKKIQQTLKEAYSNNLIQQMYVVYIPLQLKNNLFIYFIVNFKNREEILKNARAIACNSIFLRILPLNQNKSFFISLTHSKGLEKIFEILRNLKTTRIYFLQHEKSLPLLTTQKYKKHDYYKHFDPKTGYWSW